MFVDFDATEKGMTLLAAFCAGLMRNDVAFKFEQRGDNVRVYLTGF